MASTTIALRGFAGLYFLSIDGLAEAGERRASGDAFTGAFPAGLLEWRFHLIDVSNILLVANGEKRKNNTCFQLCQRTPSDSLLQSSMPIR